MIFLVEDPIPDSFFDDVVDYDDIVELFSKLED